MPPIDLDALHLGKPAADTPRPTNGNGTTKVVNGTTATKTTQQRVVSVPLIQALPKPFQKALFQEKLDRSFLFRQMAALRNGLPDPGEPNTIGDEAPDQTITIEEMRRREELSRREGLVDAHVAMLATPPDAANTSSTPPTAPDTSVLDAIKDLSGKIPGPTTIDHSPVINAIKELGNKLPGPQQPAKKTNGWLPTLVTGGLMLAGVGGTAAAVKYLSPTPQINVSTPAGTASSVDQRTIDLLRTRRLDAPKTPLGEAINTAFTKDPELRAKVMRDIEATLRKDAEKPMPGPPSPGPLPVIPPLPPIPNPPSPAGTGK